MCVYVAGVEGKVIVIVHSVNKDADVSDVLYECRQKKVNKVGGESSCLFVIAIQISDRCHYSSLQ